MHACLEGPEAGVYYRGKGEITNDERSTIYLPDYVASFAKNFTISVTGIYNKETKVSPYYTTDEFENGSFTVYGLNGKFYWVVYGERSQITAEPNKSDVEIKGFGPYRWI